MVAATGALASTIVALFAPAAAAPARARVAGQALPGVSPQVDARVRAHIARVHARAGAGVW